MMHILARSNGRHNAKFRGSYNCATQAGVGRVVDEKAETGEQHRAKAENTQNLEESSVKTAPTLTSACAETYEESRTLGIWGIRRVAARALRT